MTEQDNKSVTVLSEDNGEISDTQRREINETVSWLSNQLEKRHQSGFMSDGEYKKARQKLQNPVTATEDEKLNFFNDTEDKDRTNEDMNGLHTAMTANHSAISKRIAAFRARRNSESIQRANIVASMRADHLRLQKKRQELAEISGGSPVTSYPRFVDWHYRFKDIAADEAVRCGQATETESTSLATSADKPTYSKPSVLRKFMNFFREEYA